jgi:hypothetical protein
MQVEESSESTTFGIPESDRGGVGTDHCGKASITGSENP